MRLIDADWVLAHTKPYETTDENWSVTCGTAIRLIHNAINYAPTIDAVPIVRCKNCKYSREKDKQESKYLDPDALICTNGSFFNDGWNPVWPDDFCCYGEKKDNRHDNKMA